MILELEHNYRRCKAATKEWFIQNMKCNYLAQVHAKNKGRTE